MTPVEAAEREVEAAHEELRAAVRRADRANHLRSLEMARESGDGEWAERQRSRVGFMERSVVADYVVGTMYVDLAGGADYHAVLSTDGRCPVHRSHGLASITAEFLLGR